MRINYLTTNSLKFEIARQLFDSINEHELVQHAFSVPEVQDASCEEIARQSAVFAAEKIGEPCVVTDAGFFIPALGGFPGPFVKYINDWISEEQLLRMLNESDDRTAYFTDALAIGFPDGTTQVFSYKTMGRLAKEGEYSPSKWPANSLFIPEGYSQPLGSLSDDEQARFWAEENQTWSRLVAFLGENGK